MPTLIDGMYGIPNLSTTGNVGDESSYSSLCGIGICGDMVCGRDHVVVHILNTSKVVQETISNLVDKGISWTYNANGGCGTASFTVQRSLESPGQISQGNLVEIWRYGERQWAGVIDSFAPAITMEEPERIQVNCIGILAFLDDVIVTVTIKTQNWSTAVTAITTAFGPSVVASWTIPTISYTINDQEFIERPLSDILQTLAVLAQDGTNKPYLWGVDEDYKGYFVALPTALDTYHMSEGIQRCESLSVQKGPFSRIKNMIKGYGGTLQDGRQVVVQVNEAASRTLYGDKQSVVSNSNFRNEADFTRWLQGQAAILGYPRDTGSAELFPWYPEFRPYTHKLNVKNFDSGGDREYNIDSLTITDRGEGGWLRATAQIMNRYPVWAEMMERATNKFGPDMARNWDQTLFFKLQSDNYIVNGMTPSIPNTTTFRVGTGNAVVNSVAINLAANKDFVLTTDLTNNATNYIYLGDDGVWDVVTSIASKPAVGSHMLMFAITVGNSLVIGYVTIARIASVGTSNIIEDAVTTAKIASLAVGTTELGSGAVTTAKIASLAVGTTELGSGAVTEAKISAGGLIDGASVLTLESTTSTSWVDLTTVGPSLTTINDITRSWLVVVSCIVSTIGANPQSPYLGLSVGGDSPDGRNIFYASLGSGSSDSQTLVGIWKISSVAANTILRVKYKTSGGQECRYRDRNMVILGL